MHKYGTTESMTVHRDHDGPSCCPSTQPRFGRFPVIRILVYLGFYFFINSLKNLVFEVRLRIVRLHIIRILDCWIIGTCDCLLVLDFEILASDYLDINQANFGFYSFSLK